MNLLQSLVRADWPRLTFDDYLAQLFDFQGNFATGLQQTLKGDKEEISDGFEGLVQTAYRRNGIVFACMAARFLLFSEARFQFQAMRGGRPGDLFGTADLDILEHPWPGGTTGDLLARAEIYAGAAGNAFVVRRRDRLALARPNWMTIVLGSPNDPQVEAGDLDAEVLGYIYHPGGRNSNRKPEALLRTQVAHYAPIPDPLGAYRGMSWLTPIMREIAGDSAATAHKLKFFENGATPNMVVKRPDAPNPQAFREWVDLMEEQHAGLKNAYKTFYFSAGADAMVVGRDLQQLDFRVTQGAGETRIAAAAGIHPVIVGLSEGLQGSSLNTGNFMAARRLTADKTMRPLWRNMAGSLETIVPPPPGSRLWYDDRDIAFLREDRKDAAEIQEVKARTIRQLVDAGYVAATVVAAVEAEDMGLLEHSGLFSVQLQPPNPDGNVPANVAAGRALAALVAPHLPAKQLTAGNGKGSS